jgi:hypothetical protein
MVKIYRNNGFVFNAETERLESYKFISAMFNFAKQAFEVTCELGGVVHVVPAESLVVYVDEPRFRAKETMSGSSYTFRELFHRAYNKWPNEMGQAWAFESGEARLVDATDITLIMDDRGNVTVDGERRDFYCSSNEVYLFNDYKVVDSEGKETVRIAPANKLKLDDTQKAAVASMESALKALKDCGLTLLYDTEYETLQALPAGRVEDWSTYEDLLDGVYVDDMLEHLEGSESIYTYCGGDGGIRAVLK